MVAVSNVLSSGRNTQFFTDMVGIIQRTTLHVKNEKRRLSASTHFHSEIPFGPTIYNALSIITLFAEVRTQQPDLIR